jgi:WD40 repeat protein
MLSERITKLTWDAKWGLVAATVEGSVVVLDRDFTPVRRITIPDAGAQRSARAIYALAVAGDRVYTRNKRGTLGVADLRNGHVLKVLSAEGAAAKHLLMPGEEPSPTIVRGLGITGGYAYYSNGYFQLTRLDLDTLQPEVVTDILLDHRIDSFSLDGPLDVISDREGCLSFTDLDKLVVKQEVRVDGGNVHKAVWDALNQCYWATLDAGTGEHAYRNGIAKVSLDGRVVASWLGARNDMETIVLSNDRRLMAFGGFDNALYVMSTQSNDLQPEFAISGFSHQIIDAVATPDSTIVILTQDGELVEIGWDGTLQQRLRYERSCVWDIATTGSADHRQLLLGTDDGVEIRDVDRNTGGISSTGRHIATTAFVRRLVPLSDGDVITVLWHESVERRTRDGKTVWSVNLDKPVYECVVIGDTAFVATFDGVELLDAASGCRKGSLDLEGLPIWSVAYEADSNTLYAASRTGEVFHVDAGSLDVRFVGEIGGYPKRALWLDDQLYFTGGGGVRQYDRDLGAVSTTFKEYLDNTAENAVRVGDYVVCVSYGMQVGVYRAADGEPLALDESLADFTKSIARLSDSRFVVGGRGGFLREYELHTNPDGTVALETVSEQFVTPAAASLRLRLSSA